MSGYRAGGAAAVPTIALADLRYSARRSRVALAASARCSCRASEYRADLRLRSRSPAPRRAAGRGRHRPGQGRADPAAVGRGNAGVDRAIDEERRRDGARRIQQSRHPAAGEGRWRHRRRARSRRPQQAMAEGAEIILGPLFAQSVSRGRPGRARARRAGDRLLHRRQRRGARRLSAELPARDPTSIASSATRSRSGKRSFAALMPDNAYGTVVRGGIPAGGRAPRRPRASRMERYPLDRAQMQAAVRRVAQAARQADAIFIPDGAGRGLGVGAGARGRRREHASACSCSARGCGTTIRASAPTGAAGRLVSGAGPAGFRNFSARYRTRYGQDPVRTATLAYDAVVAGRRAGEDARARSDSPRRR